MKKNSRRSLPSSNVIKNEMTLSPPNEESDEFFTEQQVFDWLMFSNELANIVGMPLTPQMINSRMKDITINNIGGLTEEKINRAISDPKNSEIELLDISETFNSISMPYKRIIGYMANLLSFDWSYSCVNAKMSDYSSTEYKKDLDIFKDFMGKFDSKAEFRNVVQRLFLEETYFGVLRDEGKRYTIQQLPSQKCIVTGRWENGLLFSFDYSWFLNSGVDINLYPNIFKETYTNLILKNSGSNKYIPSLPIEDRMRSTWIWWGDCSPINNFWSWKLDQQVASRIPFFSSMFPDLILQPFIRGLQKSSLLAGACKFILGQVPLLEQKTKLSDALAISATDLARFLKLIQSAISNEAVRIGAAPLNNMQSMSFDSDHDIYSDYLRTTLGTSGVNSNLLFSADIKPNVEETRLSVNVDEMISFGLYNYFDRFIDYHVNRRTKKFKFSVVHEGSNFYSDKDRRWQTQKDNISFGIVNLSKIAAAQGQSPFVLQSQLEETKAMNFVDSLTPIIPSSQMSSKDGGRPQKSDSELSDSGSQTREIGGNLGKGGKI